MKDFMMISALLLTLSFLTNGCGQSAMNVDRGIHSENVSNRVYVKDEETAIRIAESKLLTEYGYILYDEKPLVATLDNDIWTVTGTLADGKVGGVAQIQISNIDGRVLKITHGK